MGEGEGRVEAGGVGGRKEDDVTKSMTEKQAMPVFFFFFFFKSIKKDTSEDAGGGEGSDFETLAAGIRYTADTEGDQGLRL